MITMQFFVFMAATKILEALLKILEAGRIRNNP